MNTGDTVKSKRDVYKSILRSSMPGALLDKYQNTPGEQLSVDEIKSLVRAYGANIDDESAKDILRKRKRKSALARIIGTLAGAGVFGGLGAGFQPDVTGVPRGVSGAVGGVLGALAGYGLTNAVDGDMNRHNRMEAEIGAPIDERTYKYAQAKLTAADIKAFREMVSQQKENARQRELRRQNRFARNRKDRVREAKAALMTVLGVAGAVGGLHAGRYVGGKLGNEVGGSLAGMLGLGAAGLVGGNILGARAGNSLADRMEQVERDTGVRVNEQEIERASHTAQNLALANLFSSTENVRRQNRAFQDQLNFAAMHAV